MQPRAHGNSHSSEPYLRTSASTLHSLKSELKTALPKEALERISRERGGEMSAESAGSLPRNRQQAYNAVKHQKPRDPLFNVILESQNLDHDANHFIREVKLAPEPSVVLAMDYQIADLEAFCTDPTHHCVFGIDPTFDLGPFNLTVTTYKQLQLIKPNGEHPTFIGPLFLHYRKTFSCYNSFASGLMGLNKNLSNICAFGTDGEAALIEAFQQQCPFATHLLCFTHCRENIKRKLRELHLPSSVSAEYLLDIFGGHKGTTFVEGLADAQSGTDFDDKLAALEEVWNKREEPFSSPPQFFAYFLKHKTSAFKESMIKPVREKAGLGSPPKQYHNNCPECINNVIKMKVGRKRSPLDDFSSKMKSLVEDQQNHLIRAVTRRGEYRLHSAFREFEVDPSKWFSLNQSARTSHLQKLQKAASKQNGKLTQTGRVLAATPAAASPGSSMSPNTLPSMGSSTSEEDSWTDGSVACTDSAIAGTPAAEIHGSSTSLAPKNTQEGSWTIDPTWIAQIEKGTAIPLATISGIWEKAGEIATNFDAITTAPVDGNARMVKSRSNPLRPHLVQILAGGKIVCDENCPMWTSLKICSHCVAVAHSMGCTSDYVKWFLSNAKMPNLTRLTTTQVPQGVGKKPSHRRYSQRKTTATTIPRAANTSTTVPPTTTAPPFATGPPFTTAPPSTTLPPFATGPPFTTAPPSTTLPPFATGPPFTTAPLSTTSPPFTTGPPFTTAPPSTVATPSTTAPPLTTAPFATGPTSTTVPPFATAPYPNNPNPNYYWNQYPNPSWNVGTPPMFSAPSFGNALSPPPLPFGYSFTVPTFTPPPPAPPRRLFWVYKLNNRITTCFGCRGKFTRAANGGLPLPPLDLILRCNESRQYRDKDGNMQEKDNSNTYYHPNVKCITQKHPDFVVADVRIEDTIKSTLSPPHMALLKSALNFNP